MTSCTVALASAGESRERGQAVPNLMSVDAAKPSEDATFVFADIAGFTALTEAHGDAEAAALVADFCAAVRAELPGSGGSQVKTIGDALMLRIPDPAAAILLALRITHELMLGHGAPAVRVGLITVPRSSAKGTTSAQRSTSPLASRPRRAVARCC
jgi:class 3 adenylate cyclase